MPSLNAASTVIDLVLKREGDKYTNRPNDRGGPTKYGITQKTLARYRGRQVTADDVRNLTETEARAIYTTMYIQDPKFDHIDDKDLRELLIDSGVQHGPDRAVCWLQAAAGAKIDGLLGPITFAAIDAADPHVLFIRVFARRMRFYGELITRDHSQAENADGWMNRIAAILETTIS